MTHAVVRFCTVGPARLIQVTAEKPLRLGVGAVLPHHGIMFGLTLAWEWSLTSMEVCVVDWVGELVAVGPFALLYVRRSEAEPALGAACPA